MTKSSFTMLKRARAALFVGAVLTSLASGGTAQAEDQAQPPQAGNKTLPGPGSATAAAGPQVPAPGGTRAESQVKGAAVSLDARRGPRVGGYYMMRFNDRFDNEVAAKKEGIFAPLKYLPLTDDVYLTLSGEERFRAVAQTYSSLAGAGISNDQTFLALRHQYGADLHLGDHVRMFGQLISAQQFGSGITKPYPGKQDDDLDLGQGFVEVFGNAAGGTAGLRAGRQQFDLGNGLLFSVQPAANVEQSYDGFVGYYNNPRLDVTLFRLKPVDASNGVFNDPTSRTTTFWGIYGSTHLASGGGTTINADPFYFNVRNSEANINRVRGLERRNVVGVRLWGSSGPVSMDWTGVYQEGDMAGRPIRAGALFTDTQFAIPGAPADLRIAVRADVATGGRENGRLQTYNPLVSANLYTTIGGFLGLSNLYEGGLGFNMRPAKKLSVQAYNRWYWRYSTDDLVYGRNFVPLPQSALTKARYIGMQPALALRYQATKRLTYVINAGKIFTGKGMRKAGLKDLAFGLLEAQFVF